jgi:hypothetical protein
MSPRSVSVSRHQEPATPTMNMKPGKRDEKVCAFATSPPPPPPPPPQPTITTLPTNATITACTTSTSTSTTTSPPPLSQVEQARTNKAELAALLEQVALLETKQELFEQQTELDDLRCAVAEMEENERDLLGEVSSI